MRDVFTSKAEAEALAWMYFKVLLPVKRDRLKAQYDLACQRMKPGERSNTKGEYAAMQETYHALLDEPWAIAGMPIPSPDRRRKRPNRGMAHRPVIFHDAEFQCA